jgi:hypothetical protein
MVKYCFKLAKIEESHLSENLFVKPVLSVYRENNEQPETEPFAVVKAKELTVKQSEKGGFEGSITDFFCLMGDVDQVRSANKYVVCWFDDRVDDFYEAFRRLSGVTFPTQITCTIDKRNKRTYNADFQAKFAKLK